MKTEQIPLKSGYSRETTAEEVATGFDLQGKIIVITGGHSGIGLETARVLSNAGATIIVGSRDLNKAGKALENIKNVKIFLLDLADPGSLDDFAEKFLSSYTKLDILINNAGIMAIPLMRDSRGYEMQFSTNHLGHFQLTARLWKALCNTGNSRVVNLSSAGHRFSGVDLEDPNFIKRPYDKWVAYGQSKTANSLFSVELDWHGKDLGIRAFAVHPGRILDTDLARNLTEDDMKAAGIYRENGILKGPSGLRSIEQGAATTVWCALSTLLEDKGGVYCGDCDISELIPDDGTLESGVRQRAVDKQTAKALWELSEKLIDLKWSE